MGVFFESQPREPVVRRAIAEALEANPPGAPEEVQREAAQKAEEVTSELSANRTFKTGRFIVALIIFAAIGAAAWIAEATELTGSSEALWALATTIFGVVVGFVGGEATSTT